MNGKKILITGKSGMLGSSIVNCFRHEDIVGFGSEIDITDSSSVLNKLSEEEPDIIIHTAAYTDVESCEINIDKAYLVNTIGTQNLVNYCIDKDILFIYVSSTGVYGTNKTEAYTEFDNVDPTTIHHKSKYEAEKIVQNHLNKYLILRTGWLYGGNNEHNKNFIYKRYLEASKNNIIYSDNTQIGNPTYVEDFVEQIKVLIENKQYGIFNCVNDAVNISRYDYVKKIVELFEVNCCVNIAPLDMYKRMALVSKNESAINYKLNLLSLNVMHKWDESMVKYINNIKREL